MKSKKKVTTRVLKSAIAKADPLLAHHLNALLHTVRCIAQHEDELCAMMHELRGQSSVGAEMNAKVNKDLGELLARMPAQEYASDLHAVQDALVANARSEQTRTRVAGEAGKKSTGRVHERKLKSQN